MKNIDFFLNDFAPITTSMAFFEVDAKSFSENVFRRLRKINDDWNFPWEVEVNRVNGDFECKLQALLPLSNQYNNFLITSTKSGWVLYLSNNFINGTDVHSQPSYFSREWRIRNLSLVMVEDVPSKKPGSFQFVLRDGTSGSLKTRSVVAHKESRWEFEEYGDPLPFELLDKYKSRKIKDRLDSEMMEFYCKHFGISLFDTDFYAGEAWLIKTYPLPQAKYMNNFPNR
ncbi:hypothetical protein E9531_17140 [Lampropedia puyangensis]|uniref:Uncharacterized protein n=1 Tax=Lampropedia puyangensis TaxID=1330072 RepID=A0A4S8EMH3_9BURK|nr:hypothetical protein [Lampropedia puyangensis]THT95456.1 hypothetical protein E9531_17140 [Lampropedia puyangensis]